MRSSSDASPSSTPSTHSSQSPHTKPWHQKHQDRKQSSLTLYKLKQVQLNASSELVTHDQAHSSVTHRRRKVQDKVQGTESKADRSRRGTYTSYSRPIASESW